MRSARTRHNGRRGRSGRRRGAVAAVTLVEILIAAIITLILLGALTYAFVAGLDMQRLQKERRAQRDSSIVLEQHLTEMLRGAKMADAVTAGTGTGSGGSAAAATTTSTTDDTTLTFFQGQTTGGGGGDAGDLGCDRLTFTTAAPAISMAARSNEDDFETQQSANGPIGGLAEVSWSLTAAGAPPDDRSGLFERLQRPSDTDPTQGGMETLIASGVRAIGFRFWDGTQWVSAWDTVAGEQRLPAAVQVNYVLDSDRQGSSAHSFVVTIPGSDVDSQNPAGPQTTSGGAPSL